MTHIRLKELRAAQVRLRQIRFAQIRFRHVAVPKIRTTQTRMAKIRAGKFGIPHNASVQFTACQARRAKVAAFQIQFGQIRSGQIRSHAAFLPFDKPLMRRQNLGQESPIMPDAFGRTQPRTFSKKTQSASSLIVNRYTGKV
jgi:hypothetical protein